MSMPSSSELVATRAGSRPSLKRALDGEADLLRQRTVVGVGEVGRLPLVEEAGELLRHAPAVGEDERRAVGADALAQGGDEGAPEVLAALRAGEAGDAGDRVRQRSRRVVRAAAIAPRRRRPPALPAADAAIGLLRHAAVERQRRRQLDGHLVDLRRGGFEHHHRARAVARRVAVAVAHPAADEARDARQRLYRGGERDALELARQGDQAVDGGDQVGAAFGAGHGVDLVEDDGGDVAQHLAPGRESDQEVEALRRGDQELRRPAQHAPAIGRRRVAAAHLHAAPAAGCAPAWTNRGQLVERRQEVALDVVVERLERRDVEDPHGAGLPGAGEQPVERPEEGGQRFAAAGGRGGEEVLAARDRRPRLPLHVGRRAEAAWNQPRTMGWKEKRVHGGRRGAGPPGGAGER